MKLFKPGSNSPEINSSNQFSVAPMLDWTDKHCRYFHRQLTSHAWLYSEMVTTGALIYGDNLPRFLGFNEEEKQAITHNLIARFLDQAEKEERPIQLKDLLQ